MQTTTTFYIFGVLLEKGRVRYDNVKAVLLGSVPLFTGYIVSSSHELRKEYEEVISFLKESGCRILGEEIILTHKFKEYEKLLESLYSFEEQYKTLKENKVINDSVTNSLYKEYEEIKKSISFLHHFETLYNQYKKIREELKNGGCEVYDDRIIFTEKCEEYVKSNKDLHERYEEIKYELVNKELAILYSDGIELTDKCKEIVEEGFKLLNMLKNGIGAPLKCYLYAVEKFLSEDILMKYDDKYEEKKEERRRYYCE